MFQVYLLKRDEEVVYIGQTQDLEVLSRQQAVNPRTVES